MKRKITPLQKIVALALAVALVAMMVTPAFAIANQTEDSYAWGNGDNYFGPFGGAYPGTTEWVEIAQLFNATLGGYLSSFTLLLDKDGLPDAELRGYLVGCNGSPTSEPNGTILATSTNTVNTVMLADTGTNATWTFQENYHLILNEPYYLSVRVEEGTLDVSTNHVHPIGDASSSAHLGGVATYRTSTGWTNSTNDLVFEVRSSSAGFDYDVPSTGDWSDMDSIVTNFISFIVPLLVLLLPAFLLCFITRRVDKWLIIIGVTIGAGLGYYFGMVPLWLVFLVTIGLIGMAYQSVRGGGGN